MAASPFTRAGLDGRLLRPRRWLLAHRRLLGAALAAVAVLATVRAVAPPPPLTQPVVVAARDLAGGTRLAAGDLQVRSTSAETTPVGALGDVEDLVGRSLAAPVREGEPLTDVRLVGAGLLKGYPGSVAMPVRVADAGAVGLVRVGDTVEVLAAEPQGAVAAEPLVRAPVVALPEATGADAGPWSGGAAVGTGGGLVVLAVTPADAARLAQAAVSRVLSLALVG